MIKTLYLKNHEIQSKKKKKKKRQGFRDEAVHRPGSVIES